MAQLQGRGGAAVEGGWSSQLESLTNRAFPVLVAARAEEELWAGTEKVAENLLVKAQEY